jgi:phosphohistidine phosphatase
MLRLHVMRHGPAEDRAPTGRDFDRALTAEGRVVVQRMAEALRAITPSAPRIFASPRRRAAETAALVAEAFALGDGAVELRDELDGEDAIPLRFANELAAEAGEALLVGHQPFVEELVRSLLYPARPALLGFRTATIVSLVAPEVAAPWALSTLHDPGRLAR